MKRPLALAILVAALPFAAHAESLKGGYAACLTEDLFDQMISAAVDKDETAMRFLLRNGCILTKSGIHVSVLDTTWTGKAKVRAYVGDDAVVLWTNIENVQH